MLNTASCVRVVSDIQQRLTTLLSAISHQSKQIPLTDTSLSITAGAAWAPEESGVQPCRILYARILNLGSDLAVYIGIFFII